MKPTVVALASVLMLGSLTLAARAGEHPKEHPQEHPKSEKKGAKESHEHPTKAGAASISMEDLAKAITSYVEKDAALKGGYFFVYDPVAKAPLQLTLDHVHKERLSKVADGVYFACADFKTLEGKVYDLDVFMKGNDPASLQVTEVSVHKEAGQPRYGWVEENGLWKKK